MKKGISRFSLIAVMFIVTTLAVSSVAFSYDREIEVDGQTYVELGVSAREHGYRVSVWEGSRHMTPLRHERCYTLSRGSEEQGTMSFAIDDGQICAISYGGNLVEVKQAFRDVQLHDGRIYVSATAFEEARG